MINSELKEGKSRKHRLAVWGGRFCSFMAFFSLLLSLGLPGVGWLIGVSALVVNSVLVPLSGRRYAILTLVVSSIHLFTFGPLSLLDQSTPVWPPITDLVIFVAVPIAIALISIFASPSLFRKIIS